MYMRKRTASCNVPLPTFPLSPKSAPTGGFQVNTKVERKTSKWNVLQCLVIK